MTNRDYGTGWIGEFGGWTYDWVKESKHEYINKRDYKTFTKQFLKYLDGEVHKYKTKDIYIMWGHDFAYKDAKIPFTNIDNMLKYLNKHFN
mgnify:CR=1 FL=1